MELDVAYQHCRALHRAHGRSYYLATRLLPAWKRRHVHALYGFARHTDEIVDSFDEVDARRREAALDAWTETFLAKLDGARSDGAGSDGAGWGGGAAGSGSGSGGMPLSRGDLVLSAVLHTIEVFGLDHKEFRAFLRSMRMDLTVTSYATYPDLLAYMEGSAAAIGAMMLPVLGTRQSSDLPAAVESARELGRAFQLTNFIRDVAEDLRRGRVYLPEEDLRAYGVDGDALRAAASTRRSTPAIKRLIASEIDRAQDHYRAAKGGIDLLESTSRRCIRTAYRLYRGILEEIAHNDFEVFAGRVRVPTARRLVFVARSTLFAT